MEPQRERHPREGQPGNGMSEVASFSSQHEGIAVVAVPFAPPSLTSSPSASIGWSRRIDRIGFSSLVVSNPGNVALGLVILASCIGSLHNRDMQEGEEGVQQLLANDSSLQTLYYGAWTIACTCLMRLLLLYPVIVRLWKWTVRVFQESGDDVSNKHFDGSSLLTRVTSSQAVMMTRIRSTVSSSSVRNLMALCHHHRSPQVPDRPLAISARECFVPLGVVEQLALGDVADLFRYAAEVRRKHAFDRSAFVASLPPASPLVRRGVLDAIDRAAAESSGIEEYLVAPNTEEMGPDRNDDDDDEVDALHFCAAVRIFAEWRSLRLVPPGCNQRYAIGMNLARRDLVQNVLKVEEAVRGWLLAHHHRHLPSDSSAAPTPQLRRPTLKQLLAHEKGPSSLHPRLPRLTDRSGASGLLWTVRQLTYQTRLFANLARIPYHFETSRSAVTAAYEATYRPYHGFIVRNIFQSSFEAAPDADSILRFMELPSLDGGTVSEDQEWSDLDEDSDESRNEEDDGWVQLPVEEPKEDSQPYSCSTADHFRSAVDRPLRGARLQPSAEFPTPLDHVGSFVEEHWSKLQKLVGQCVGFQADGDPYRNVMEATGVVGSSFDPSGDSSKDENLHTVANVIPSFLAVLQPLLTQLDKLIDELNMNDPTKI